MPCDTWFRENQTLTERKTEVKKTVDNIGQGLASGRIKATVGPQGAVAFTGVSDTERNRVTDACAYRQIMVSGSALAKAAIARAEQIAGRTVNKAVVGQGVHGHPDGKGGITWHDRKG